MGSSVAVGLLGLGEQLPSRADAVLLRLLSWMAILTGVSALATGYGGMKEAAAALVGFLPPFVWKLLPVETAVRMKGWVQATKAELPEHSTPSSSSQLVQSPTASKKAPAQHGA
jgi:hypothetical protein